MPSEAAQDGKRRDDEHHKEHENEGPEDGKVVASATSARSTINLKQTVAGSSSGWQTKKQQQKIWPPHCHRQQVLVGFFRRLTMVFADSCVSQTLAGRRL